MESKTSSKSIATALKESILRAWRERWTDIQWGIHVKTILPRGVTGDVYNLSDIILRQTFVGNGANQLALSYLRHCLSSQLVSHAFVLQALSKFEHFDRVHCLTSLLEFLEVMLPGVTNFTKQEEVILARSVLSIVILLVNILNKCKDNTVLVDKAIELLKTILTDGFYVSMICLAKYNDPELFKKLSQECGNLSQNLQDNEEATKYISMLANMDINMLQLSNNSEKWPGTLIQSWLQIQLIGNPGSDISGLLYKLRILQKMKGYSYSRLCAELIRGTLLSHLNVSQTDQSQHQSRLGAFIFLNLPHILQDLSRKSDGTTIVDALELLLQHSQLLDTIDANGSCTIMKSLLDELVNIRLLSEEQAKRLMEKRNAPTTLKSDSSPPSSIDQVISCAQASLNGVLKSLSESNHKIHDAVLGMLLQVLTVNAFHLILAVACCSGQLKALVARLIRFSELSKLAQDESRIQLFDISFVILIAIIQNYGASYVLDPDGVSLIEQWVNGCLINSHNPKAPTQLLAMCNPTDVETLIQKFNAGDSEFSPNMKLRDILFNMPGVMHEVLVAWEQGALAASDVKRILDAVREKTNCLPIAAATYLCSYMRTAPPETLLKPMNMVQQLLAIPAALEEEELQSEETDSEREERRRQKETIKMSLRDRWRITCDIIRKMQKDIQLPTVKSTHHLESRGPATKWLHTAWDLATSRGWLDDNSTRSLHCLLETAGPRWMVNVVVQLLMKLKYRDQLQRGVDLALSIFHLDIVACTLELLSHILPQLLFVEETNYKLVEPQLSALACLTTFCIYTAWDALTQSPDKEGDNTKIESKLLDATTLKEPPMKLPRLDGGGGGGESITSMDNSEQLLDKLDMDSRTKKSDENPEDALVDALLYLFGTYQQMQHEGVTPQTYFIFHLLTSMVEKKIDSANTLLAHIPRSLISDLLKTLPDLFSYPMLLHLHDIRSTMGRGNMAKDICILRNYHLRNAPIKVEPVNTIN